MTWSSGEKDTSSTLRVLLYYQVHALCANCCLRPMLSKRLGKNGPPKTITNRIIVFKQHGFLSHSLIAPFFSTERSDKILADLSNVSKPRNNPEHVVKFFTSFALLSLERFHVFIYIILDVFCSLPHLCMRIL